VVTARGRTNRLVGLFWKFRGNARSMFLADNFQPLSFTYERRENNKSAITWVDFDAMTGRAVGVRVKKGKRESVEVDGRRFIDPIAAVFRARARAVKVGVTIRQGVFTGERQYEIALTVLSEEPVSVPAGRFEALRLKPELERFDRDGERKDQDRRLRNAIIWVSRDPSHTLLRVRSKVFIGAVTLDLVKFSPAP